MTTNKIYWDDLGVRVDISAFAPANGVKEYHAIMHIEPRTELFDGQIDRIYKAEDRLFAAEEYKKATPVMKRYFVSDATNQQPLMRVERDCSISIIQQPPLDGSKVAVWVYLQEGVNVSNDHGMVIGEHNGYRDLWKMGMMEPNGDSAYQTATLLTRYEDALAKFGATLADNCIRTWFFVRDVDTQYAGMVKARKDNFTEQGLTEKTHYISSTGIGGLPADPHALVQLGTYALTGFKPEQQRYLYAPTHLNPTYEYGVTFERGTLVEYGDRRQVYISGTASINNKGEVMHVGDIVKQTERMWENVGVLLDEGGTSFDDLAQIVVYLRDLCDYPTVKQMFDRKFPDTPKVITLAPVCRPTWLIEMECIAIKANKNDNFRDF